MFGMRRQNADFTISQSGEPSQTLLAGFASAGLAGLTAVDYLVDHLDLEQTGHLTAEGMPAITPFVDGRPRHHTRLFSRGDLDVTALAGELFIPPSLGPSLGDAILEWTTGNEVREVVLLTGVPIPHGPEAHRTFYIATDDFREHRLGGTDIQPMGSGFLDGTNAALIARGLDSPLEVCVLVTPIHAQAPDVEAAIRLVETVDAIYDLGVDSDPLKSFANEVQQYYADLAARMHEQEGEELSEDRMYM